MDEEKYMPENHMPKLTEKALEKISDVYKDYYLFRSQRDGALDQFQGRTLIDVLTIARRLFWNSTKIQSEDLEELGLDFSIPYTRKEVLDFVGSITKLKISPKLVGDSLNAYEVKVLQGIYKKWRLKSKDKVQKFWQVLYGATNGTLCTYVGFDNNESSSRKLTQFDEKTGKFTVTEKKIKKWNDVTSEIVPIEEMYLAKIWERDIQKQGKTIRRQEYLWEDFKKEYPESKFPNTKYVRPGNMIDSNSLFFQLLSGTGITSTNRIQVLTIVDDINDEYIKVANGIWFNALGNDTPRPLPFDHKKQPYTWTIAAPQDEKFAYGVPIPFSIKDLDRILNTSQTMQVERELRTIDPPILTSDFEAPEIIFGDKRIIPVNDINAYRELTLAEPSGQFMNMQNSLQSIMSSMVQGGTGAVAISRQPKSAKEINEISQMKQDALGVAIVMYYDLVYQELFLVLKTALQFYSVDKYDDQKQNILRSMTVPNFQLTQGGIGNLELRIVKEPQDALTLHFEAVNKSIDNGKNTEIIEAPVELLMNLEFFVDDIQLEPEKSDDMERAAWNEQVLGPLVNVWIPMGIASPEKSFLRWAEKNGEHPSDFASDKAKGQVVQDWMNSYELPKGKEKMPVGDTTGNLNQSATGMRFGSQSNGGLGQQQ